MTRREVALRRAILEKQNDDQLHRAAEAVRVAQLNISNAKLATAQLGKNGLATQIQPGMKLVKHIKLWSEITADEIVAMYQANKLHEAN